MIIDCHVHVNQYELLQNVSSLEERLEMLNDTRWDDEVNKIIFQKEMGDRIISELPPSAKELYPLAKHDKELFSKLPREQQQVLLNAGVADEHLHDAQQTITSLASPYIFLTNLALNKRRFKRHFVN